MVSKSPASCTGSGIHQQVILPLEYPVNYLTELLHFPDAYPPIPEGISIRTPDMTPFARSPSPSLGFCSSEFALATMKDFVVSELRNEGDSWSTASLKRHSTPKEIIIQNLPYLQYLDFIKEGKCSNSRISKICLLTRKQNPMPSIGFIFRFSEVQRSFLTKIAWKLCILLNHFHTFQ